MNRLAVCLRGEVRNWDYTKDAVFKFYENIAYSVDYYYATWDLPYVAQDNLNATFANKKLIQGVMCPAGNDRQRWGSRLGPAFLSSHIKLNKKYDLVVDVRFDTVPVLLNSNISIPEDNEIQTEFVHSVWNHKGFENNTLEATSDQWAIMNHPTYERFNYRLSALYDTHIKHIRALDIESNNNDVFRYNEIAFHKVLIDMQFGLSQCTWMNNCIVRPSIVDIFPNATSITKNDYATIRENTHSYWSSLPHTQKIDYCTKQNIHIQDYQLNLTTYEEES